MIQKGAAMSRNLWKQVLCRLNLTDIVSVRSRRRRLSFATEPLEIRLVLAVTVTFQNGNLSIVGDNAGNQINLTRQANGNLVVTANSQINTIGGTPTLNNVAAISIDGKGGNDVITLIEIGGSLPRVTINGGSGNDTIQGGSGADIIIGGVGNDTIRGGAGDDDLRGNVGIDQILGGTGNDSILGGPDNDTLTGDAGDDKIFGDAGDDLLRGGTGSDLISGGTENDSIFGQAGDDVINGDDGNDVLRGEAGDDIITGGSGNDNLIGGAGADRSSGGSGNDSYTFDPDVAEGIDSLFENANEGTDGLRFTTTTTVGVSVDLSKTDVQIVAANLSIILSANNTFENAIGGAMNDTFIGNTRVNRFTGGAGRDTFIHHGTGDGIDVITDMTASQADKVSFVTGGILSAADLTIDATATQLRDVATNSFGFNFTVAVLNAGSSYGFGTTDTATPGSLFTFSGTGGFGLGTNADALMACYTTNGVTIGGAGFRQRIIDYSANGNTLAGRDGDDILDGGAGNDNLNGDQGFNPGGNDTITGGIGNDSFFFGQPFTGPIQAFGADTLTDFETGADTIKLAAGLSVRSGLGTTTVTIWNGVTDFGTIFASNGHLWVAGDFT